MARYIDADKVKENPQRCFTDGFDNYIDSQPTVDAVPVVRCKDCFMWEKDKEEIGGVCPCRFHSTLNIVTRYTPPDGFCFMGERKETLDANQETT